MGAMNENDHNTLGREGGGGTGGDDDKGASEGLNDEGVAGRDRSV